MKNISIVILCALIFTICYAIFAGGIDSHFWLPFIIIVAVSSGLGKTSLWKDGKTGKKIKRIVGIK